MTHKRATIRCIVTALTLMVVTGIGYADVMTYNGLPLKRTVTIHDPSLTGGQKTTSAGQFSITYKGMDYWSYCVEITQSAGTMDAIEQSITTLPNYQLVGYLFETFGPQVTNTGAASLQVAIWEAVFETGPTFNTASGTFYIDPGLAIISNANAMINSFPGSYNPTAIRLANPCKQDMLIVPEPATMGLLSFGAAGLIARRKRRAG